MTDFTGFTAPAFLNGEVQNFEFDGQGASVLAFFPGAFTGVCTEEMCRFRDSMNEFSDLDAKVIGISVDTPFALQAFADQNDLNFTLVSDTDAEIADRYGVKTEFPDLGYSIAERAVFLVKNGEVKYSQVMEDMGEIPDMDKLKQEISDL